MPLTVLITEISVLAGLELRVVSRDDRNGRETRQYRMMNTMEAWRSRDKAEREVKAAPAYLDSKEPGQGVQSSVPFCRSTGGKGMWMKALSEEWGDGGFG